MTGSSIPSQPLRPLDFTVVLTSYDRLDLLKVTLGSFLTHADAQPKQTILIEDSPAPIPTWLTQNQAHYERHLGPITWLQNSPRLGQIHSIDRAYSQVTTPYIFHLEDDWEFLSGDFLQESRELLDQHPDVVTVSLRGNTGWHPSTGAAASGSPNPAGTTVGAASPSTRVSAAPPTTRKSAPTANTPATSPTASPTKLN
jgi:hypothetical protein